MTLDGKTIKAGAVLGTDWGSHRHLLAHEGGHTISLPDLYGGPGGHGYIGSWDLMGNLGGVAPDRFAWHKWKPGWLDDNQISCVRTWNTSVTTTLSPVETAGGTKVAVVRYGNSTAYVAEVRARLVNDSRACKTGVLVYKVDSVVASGSGPVRVMDSRPASGGRGGRVGGTTVVEIRGAASVRGGAWTTSTADLSGFGAQTVQLTIEVGDVEGGSLLEAGVDDILITRA